MAVNVTCTCGTPYSLKDDMAGKALSCRKCGAVIQLPAIAAPLAQADPVFDRDKFLLNQKVRIDEKYVVLDEGGKPLLYIVRPRFFLRNLAAMLAGIVAAIVVLMACLALVDALPKGGLSELMAVVTIVVSFGALFTVAISLAPKRHVKFSRDELQREPLLEVLQDKKFQPITATYTVRTPSGQVIALLRKNYLFNIVRKRWYCDAPDGRRICVAKEESIILSLLRRVLGPFFGLLRANFIFLRGNTDQVIGEFNRKFTLLDRYVLDLSADRARTLDRRVALALGVMLDTGERR